MNVLFLTLLSFNSLQERNIYTDLLREFVKNGHRVNVISPTEKREGQKTHMVDEGNATILRLQIGNIQKTNILNKGINTVLLESYYKKAIKQYYPNVRFDLVLYSTPPITLVGAIKSIKKSCGSRTYLLLKDIFPQNAVDLGMMSTTGLTGLIYKHFRRQEMQLYALSDRIGCMSQANVDYVIKHNAHIDPRIVEVCANSIDIIDKSLDFNTKQAVRSKYDIPFDKIVFVYGGNLGKPQDIPFIIECLKRCTDLDEAYFLIIGDGTEYGTLEKYVKQDFQKNVRLMRHLPKEEYDTLVGACDIGMIFLDHRFTIPNFPSRLLSYLQAKLPILAVTDLNTDIGKAVADGKFGYWCYSDYADEFRLIAQNMVRSDLEELGQNGFEYLKNHYSSAESYKTIINSLEKGTL